MQFISVDATIFKKNQLFFAPENIKKHPQKLLIIGPQFFYSVLPTGPKPAQISFSVP
jgi:hypothetical protein